MAEHGAERDGSRDNDDGQPLDEDAVWAAIVAGYGEEPADPPGARPFKSVEDLAGLTAEAEQRAADGKPDATADPAAAADRPKNTGDTDSTRDAENTKDTKNTGDADKPLGGSITFAPGVGPGPRDYAPSDASDDDFDATDEGHFVPPEPPPLPEADATAKFAWLAVVGGPLLLLLAVLFHWDMTWWLTTLGIGGFVGGFATLVLRMRGDDEDDDEGPGRGAVV